MTIETPQALIESRDGDSGGLVDIREIYDVGIYDTFDGYLACS